MKGIANSPARLSDNALRLLHARYLIAHETPDDMFWRVARSVAHAELTWGNQHDVERWADAFHHAMSTLCFLPNSPTLMNAGTKLNQLSACFVLPIADSLEEIFTTLKHAALIQQSGGGTGFNFSALRPRNDIIKSTGGVSSGPVSFLQIFDSATEYVKQGGKRRGANMGIINDSHPDVEEFVSCKTLPSTLRNFNISVGISNRFMSAVESDAAWDLVHPHTGLVTKTMPARTLWKAIAESAWRSGDPGLVFLDHINAYNPTPMLGSMECTNPCGEVPMLPYESCNLGSINLSAFVNDRSVKSDFDWGRLANVVSIATRFLDNVIEVNYYLLPETKRMAMGNRKIGLGVMGWADALGKRQIPYASKDAVALGNKLMRFIEEKSISASVQLASQRGAFPNWGKSVYFPQTPIRNATRTSIAPTGSISILANTSPSIEPWFALAFDRTHVLNDETLSSINPIFQEYLEQNVPESENVLQTVRSTGSAKGTALSAREKAVFQTALEIAPYWHLQHQVAFQKHTDNAVSKTINLPEKTSSQTVAAIYLEAWKNNLKGITVFRDDSAKPVMVRGIRTTSKACKICTE